MSGACFGQGYSAPLKFWLLNDSLPLPVENFNAENKPDNTNSPAVLVFRRRNETDRFKETPQFHLISIRLGMPLCDWKQAKFVTTCLREANRLG
jgi:hypothetical protein